MSSRRGVLLLNLGSPDSPGVADVRRYLREFLMDGRVLDAPYPVRWMVVNAFILPFRPRRSAEAYGKIWTKEGSPLIAVSEKVRAALDDSDMPVFLAMNYGQPSVEDTLDRVAREGIEDLLVVPLYPHYAMSSYETVLVKTMDHLRERLPRARTTIFQPFYRDADYIGALHESCREILATEDYDHILFSFHGIPERHLRKSDPSHAHCLTVPDCCNVEHPAHHTCYRHQCFATARLLAERAGLRPETWRVTFQSRLGRDPWLQPYTDETLSRLPGEGVKKLLVFCPAFVTDCLETLEEISMEGRETFLEAGGESFRQVPCLNDHPAWLDFLRRRFDRWATTGRAGPA